MSDGNRVVEVDLGSGRIRTFEVTPEARRLFLGGKGLALRYLAQGLPAGTDPLSGDNLFIVMNGPLVGSGAPCSARFCAVTKSPLTGLVASSSCGGPFGTALKSAGYEGLILRGACRDPSLLCIEAGTVRLEPAHGLWGLDTWETQAALHLGKKDGALVIGPAGENGVLFANVASGHRFLGRAGFGAVLGSKKIKAVVARGGSYRNVPAHPETFQAVKKKATVHINRNPFTGELYRRYGTAGHLDLCARSGILPVHNFSDGSHPESHRLSGQAMRHRFGGRPSTCTPCTILCGHRGTFPDGAQRQLPEYETVGLLGAGLGIFDPVAVARWNELCGRLGLDTISCGGVLAFTMEAGRRGLVHTPLRFGHGENVEEAIQDLAYRRGLGNLMAEGTRRMSQQVGGEDFSMQVKGLDLPAYDPRGSWGQGLAYAVANRGGCHLSATLFALEVFLGLLDPYTTRGKARYVRFFESLYAAINSLSTCLFTTYAYLLEAPVARWTPKPLLAWTMGNLPALALRLMDVGIYCRLFQTVTGTGITQRELLKAGDRIITLERLLNVRQGLTRKDDTLPKRLLTQARSGDPQGRTVPLSTMLEDYYRLRGYDAQGRPTPKALKRLGLESI
ncbi:aldehyde ferredoxin oxidoreductase family protein [Desulfacinum hydrothermale]|uniref:aldehyde ferredoxin oxidoreductase family protein n=1 Tax=Desulfacinum hydrothermale TaxID=109258 RepID=UPI001BB01CCC|nr:aldehyde ferredoxin oxidoreductase family protein [Desulfacinum hydrothermale]